MGNGFPLPRNVYKVATFQAREVYPPGDTALSSDTVIKELSTLSLNDQIEEWLAKSKALVCSASSPTQNMMKDSEGRQILLSGVTLLYYAAVTEAFTEKAKSNDGTEDPRERKFFPTGTPYGSGDAPTGS